MAKNGQRKVLMIAFHFPPLFGSSGIQRTLSFVKYLAQDGRWCPIVLSADKRAYPSTSDSQTGDIPESVQVRRAFALDSARHLSFKGRYVAAIAMPDRWITWYPFAVRAGMKLVREHEPDVIWSTYPIPTAHRIAATIARKSGLPWVCDFRDPMVEYDAREDEWHPGDAVLRAKRLSIEAECIECASSLVFCTESARQICTDRYRDRTTPESRVIANGFDEEIFQDIENGQRSRSNATGADRSLTLLHSGTLYPGSDRSPAQFFAALGNLKSAGHLDKFNIKVVLRATGYDNEHARLADAAGVSDLIVLAPPLPYREALIEMYDADALLLFQGYTSNPAIPAKLYEYCRTGRPILALTDPHGETAWLLNSLNAGAQANIENAEEISQILPDFLAKVRIGKAPVLDPAKRPSLSRSERTNELIQVFDEVVR